MPVLAFFAVVGSVLLAFLLIADATLEQSDSPVIVTSQRTGLPAPRYHNAIKTITTAQAPEPDMASQAVLSAQPTSQHTAPPKIEPAARAARAEALPNKLRIEASAKARVEAQPQNKSLSNPSTNTGTNSIDFPLRIIRPGSGDWIVR